MHKLSCATYLRQLENLSVILKKAETHSKLKKIEETVFINGRLAPDMFSFARQIQIACDFAKASCARLASVEIPSFADQEKTFFELQERIRKTANFIATIDPNKFDGSEKKQISYSVHGMNFDFLGCDYLLNFALPNFYFHYTAAYAILRHLGVEIGKEDFIGKIVKN